MDLVYRFIVGGLVVSLFSVIGDVLRPKGFAGLFAAAPSVALATLSLVILTQGASYALRGTGGEIHDRRRDRVFLLRPHLCLSHGEAASQGIDRNPWDAACLGPLRALVRVASASKMRIHLNLGSLRQIKWHEYLTRFLLGGAITVATGLIARKWGPVVGGVFLAFPAIFPASATLLEKHKREKKRRAGIPTTIRGRLAAALDARGAAMGTIALAVFALLIWKLLPRYNPTLIMAAALALWLSVSIVIWRLRKFRVYSRR
jgi:hypothetical protein